MRYILIKFDSIKSFKLISDKIMHIFKYIMHTSGFAKF